KVIWRATGCGDLAVVAVDEEGLTLTSAPQAHAGSTWIRPGDEWGSGFTFPHGGCWELFATPGRHPRESMACGWRRPGPGRPGRARKSELVGGEKIDLPTSSL